MTKYAILLLISAGFFIFGLGLRSTRNMSEEQIKKYDKRKVIYQMASAGLLISDFLWFYLEASKF